MNKLTQCLSNVRLIHIARATTYVELVVLLLNLKKVGACHLNTSELLDSTLLMLS